jgi:hypothetical protein
MKTSIRELGERINDNGREFKVWFTDFTLVFSPIFIVFGLILTGVDLFLNLGLGNSLLFKIPWSIAQLFAVDGLWFAVWNRILTDEYRRHYIPYHAVMIVFGVALTGIAITMNWVIFTQDYRGLADGAAAMRYLHISVDGFLLVRSVLLMLTATLAIVLDKVMRTKKRYRNEGAKKPMAPANAQVSVKDTHVSVNEQVSLSTGGLLTEGTLTQISEHAEALIEPLTSTNEHPMSTPAPVSVLTKWGLSTMLTQNGSLSLKELSVSTGVSYSTLTRWKRELMSPINVTDKEPNDG